MQTAFESVRMLPLKMRSQMVIVLVFKSMLDYLHENRELAIGKRIIRDLPVSNRPHVVAYGCLACHGCPT